MVFLHPVHNYAIVAYDPSALGAVGASVVRAAELLPGRPFSINGFFLEDTCLNNLDQGFSRHKLKKPDNLSKNGKLGTMMCLVPYSRYDITI